MYFKTKRGINTTPNNLLENIKIHHFLKQKIHFRLTIKKKKKLSKLIFLINFILE